MVLCFFMSYIYRPRYWVLAALKRGCLVYAPSELLMGDSS